MEMQQLARSLVDYSAQDHLSAIRDEFRQLGQELAQFFSSQINAVESLISEASEKLESQMSENYEAIRSTVGEWLDEADAKISNLKETIQERALEMDIKTRTNLEDCLQRLEQQSEELREKIDS